MKRLLALILALTMVMSMAACGDNAEPTGESTTAPSAPANNPTDPSGTTAPTEPAEKPEVLLRDSYSVSDDQAIAGRETVIATIGDEVLTNGVLQVFYWQDVFSFLTQYGSYAIYYGLDHTKPLDEQKCSMIDGTWQQYFLQDAIKMWHTYAAMAYRADQEGIPTSQEDQDRIDGLPEALEKARQELKFDTVDEMVQADMGPGVTAEDYITYQTLYYRSYSYYNHLMDTTTFNDLQVEGWFTSNTDKLAQSGITKETVGYDVRHILIEVAKEKTDADWTKCQTDAQAILDQWLAGEKTEDSFADLAKEKSADGGSASNGGLYTDLTKDTNFVQPFKDWYLDSSRQAGDTGLVKSDYGYHVMYFSGSGLIWMDYCRQAMTQESVTEQMEAIVSNCKVTIAYDDIGLGVLDMTPEETEQ